MLGCSRGADPELFPHVVHTDAVLDQIAINLQWEITLRVFEQVKDVRRVSLARALNTETRSVLSIQFVISLNDEMTLSLARTLPDPYRLDDREYPALVKILSLLCQQFATWTRPRVLTLVQYNNCP